MAIDDRLHGDATLADDDEVPVAAATAALRRPIITCAPSAGNWPATQPIDVDGGDPQPTGG